VVDYSHRFQESFNHQTNVFLKQHELAFKKEQQEKLSKQGNWKSTRAGDSDKAGNRKVSSTRDGDDT